ncbi:MAG TPA: ATP-binding cassette domain-containing protein [Steroidobacteraceae bacterium]|nr:ATP-binding cassette domain-containing protein [Steroidobacteraceae bacterium]
MIAFDQVSKSYGTDAAAVHNLSFTVGHGEFLVLIGESGCGKTTTLNMVNRLIAPSAGTIRLEGEDIAALDGVRLRRRIGYLFQEIGLFPHMTVEENIVVTPRLLGWPPAARAARARELMGLVRLAPERFAARFPAELSGGQRQRVGLARALAAEPKIMLMDEPFTALDPITRDDLSEEYRRIHESLGLTTILVTHDVTEAFLLADRIAVMHAGEILQIATPHELVSAPAGDFVRTLIETPRRRARKLADALEVRDAP